MYKWVLLGKCSIAVYCMLVFIFRGMQNAGIIVFCLLTYVFLNLLHTLINKHLYKKLVLAVAIVFLSFCAYMVDPLFILLLPGMIFELAFVLSQKDAISLMALLVPVLAVGFENTPEYIFVSILEVLLFYIYIKEGRKIEFLSNEIDNLRQSNDRMHSKLSRSSEYERQLKYSSQLEERNRISQAIHDKVGHALAGSLIQLEAASLLAEKDPEKAKSIIKAVKDILNDGMENIRAILRDIKPAAEHIGINRLKTLLEEFSAKCGIQITLIAGGDIEKINGIQWKVITDNAVEALTNSMKYSKCTAISAKLDVLNKAVRFEIKDNGKGCIAIKKGLGIKGMEERCEGISGKLIIDGSNGFSIISLLPFA